MATSFEFIVSNIFIIYIRIVCLSNFGVLLFSSFYIRTVYSISNPPYNIFFRFSSFNILNELYRTSIFILSLINLFSVCGRVSTLGKLYLGSKGLPPILFVRNSLDLGEELGMSLLHRL